MTTAQLKKRTRKKKSERGVALFIALFALLLLSGIAAGMIYMADTDTSINWNYRDSQRAYYASQAGLEYAREAIRVQAIALPLVMPNVADKTGVVYIVNPDATDGVGGVAPWDPNNKYFDNELCHENFAGLALANPGANVPCTAAPAGTYYTSYTVNPAVDPYANTKGALSYKWVRVTLKANASTPPYYVDSTPGVLGTYPTKPDSTVCWNNNEEELMSRAGHEMPLSAAPLEYAAAQVEKLIELNTPAVFAFGNPHTTTGSTTSTTGSTTTTGSSNGNGTGNGSGSSSTTGSTTTGSTTSTSTTGTTTTGSTTTATTTTGSTTTGSTTTGTTTTGSTTTGTTTTGSTTTGTTTTGSTTTGGTTTGSTGATGTGATAYTDICQNYDKTVKGITYPTRYAVYLVTALAVTPSGARRLTQYELSRNRLSLPAPSSLTFDGPNPTFMGSSSAVFAVSGDDGCAPTTGVPALGAVNNSDITNLTTGMGSRSSNYTGVPDATGNISSGINGSGGGTDMTTVSGLKELSSYIQDNADQTFTTSSQLSGATYGTNGSPLVTVIDNGPSAGNFTATLGPNWVGHGIILVTGDLEIKGNFSFDGLIYVIGTGHIIRDGGGNGTLNGAIFTANIDSGTSGDTPGSPYVDLTGGGSSNFQYNSCSINMNATKSAYQIVSFRELTY